MNSEKTIKFKRLIATDWLSNSEAEFALSVINISGGLAKAYEEFTKMSSSIGENEGHVLIEGVSLLDHFTIASEIKKKIDKVILTDDDIRILKET